MAEVKWIRINTDMFNNAKIKYLRTLPDGNNVILIWVMLLTIAGRCNSNGFIFLTENIPYTTKMLSDELDFEENTIILALNSLASLNMIQKKEESIFITGWEEHQNILGLEKIKEQTRNRVAKHRENQRVIDSNVTVTLPVTQCNATDIDKDKEVDKDIYKEKINYQQIADMYNEICISFPRLTKISEARKKAIKARLNTYTVEDFKKLFELTEKSDFLKGKNNRNWSANFDWLVKDSNMAKVLDGNYANTSNNQGNQKTLNKNIHNFPEREYTGSDYETMEQKLLNRGR
ncbi:MAG: hypothetical protein K0S18_1704 [Anaerocolumna sp.]|jgi:predicted phage replisome organizer|nr:hypothetical protein [Anaerocolumna sp.]